MSDDIDFGLDLGLEKSEAVQPEKVVSGPWASGAEAEAKVKAANEAGSKVETFKARQKSAAQRLDDLSDKVKERMAARMLSQVEDFLGEAEEMPLEDRLAKMASLAKRYTERPHYKPGDLVSPIKNVQAITDAGEPHIVLEWRGGFYNDDPNDGIKSFVNTANLDGNDTTDSPRNIFGAYLDMRVMTVSKTGNAAAFWAESSWFEYWAPPEAEQAPVPEEAAAEAPAFVESAGIEPTPDAPATAKEVEPA